MFEFIQPDVSFVCNITGQNVPTANSGYSSGLDEAGVPPIGPAIANAFAAMNGGARLRQYPFLPERVKAMLKT